MTGGIVQLVAYGHEDLFLTRDPQITFFKIMYRRHTNFAREEIPQHFISDNVPDFGQRRSCTISQEADLLCRLSLKIILPKIPAFTTTTGQDSMKRFAWIRKIGFAMIKYVEIEINGKVIDKHYGEWLHIWSSLTTRNINDKGLDKLIGDVPELTDFSSSKEEYILYVPLYFWLCRNSGLALPLICLQYSDIKVNVEFYNFDECYIISPTHYISCVDYLDNFEPFEYLSQIGVDGVERYGIFSHYDVISKRLYYTAITQDKLSGVPYDGDTSQLDATTKLAILSTPKSNKYNIYGVSSGFYVKPDINVTSMSVHTKPLKNIHLKECTLLADYVYIDDDERFRFAQSKHDYLIEQLYYSPNIAIEGTNPKIKLDIDQPCKLTVWIAQLDYISNFNDRFNYTDSHVLKRPYDTSHTNPSKIKTYNQVNIGEEIGGSLIVGETIRLNSQPRLETKNNDYFEFVQPLQHTNNMLPRGCGMYSYALFPTDTSPSGATNMSQLELIELYLKMNYKVNVNRKAKFRSYSLCYNVWRVDNGLSALVFIH